MFSEQTARSRTVHLINYPPFFHMLYIWNIHCVCIEKWNPEELFTLKKKDDVLIYVFVCSIYASAQSWPESRNKIFLNCTSEGILSPEEAILIEGKQFEKECNSGTETALIFVGKATCVGEDGITTYTV